MQRENERDVSWNHEGEEGGGLGTVREECEGGVAFGVGHFGVGVARDHYRVVVSFGFESTFRCCLAVMICHSVPLDAVVIVVLYINHAQAHSVIRAPVQQGKGWRQINYRLHMYYRLS